MFVKTTKGGSKNKPIEYLQLVHNFRKDGKVKQKVIGTLGPKEQLVNSGQIDNIIEKLSAFSKNLIVLNSNNENIKNIKLYGTALVVSSLWKRLALDKIFSGVSKKYKFKFDLNSIIKTLVINRLSDPKSKLAVDKWKETVYGIETEDIELHNIYRTIDYLAENKDVLEKHLFEKTTGLFKSEVNVVFYDLTTIYLESQKEDNLKKFGYSKENKTDCVQVMLGLTINKDGLPLGYEIFPGNTFEGKTVCRMLDKLQGKFLLKRLIFVADKGILSENVLTELESKGYEYIVAAKLSQTKKSYHSQILDKTKYKQITEDIHSSEIKINHRRLVLGFSEQRAGRDKYQRDTLLSKLEKKIEKSGINGITKSQYNKYLSKSGKLEVGLSSEKIEGQAKWDGFFGFLSNSKMSSSEVVSSYRMLWQIEDSFRTLKSTLDLRPMYHWTDKRIEGHIMLCFLSLYILRAIEFYAIKAGYNYSPEKILEALKELKAIEIEVGVQTIYVRNEISGISNELLRALNIKIPPFILAQD